MAVTVPVSRAGQGVLLAPLAVLLATVRAAVRRPAVLAGLTVLLVCVPGGNEGAAASVHVTPADLGSAALVAAVVPGVLAGRRLPRTGLWVALGGLVLALGLATLRSPDPGTSLAGFVRYLQVFVLVPLAMVLAIRSRRDVWLVLGAALAAAVLEGAVGVWQYLTGTGASYAGQDVRAVGTFGAWDVMGMSTVDGYGLVVALGLALVLRGRARLGLLALALALVPPLLLSLSRGAVVATLGAAAAALAVAGWRTALRAAVFGTALAVVVSGTLSTGTAGLGARFATIGSSVTAPDRSVSDRYELWQTALGAWRDHPVTGIGLKQFAAYRDSYAPLHLSSGSDVADPSLGFRREPLLSPHNMYLLVLSEQGLAGALAFGTLLLGLAVLAWRRTREVAEGAGPPDGRNPDGQCPTDGQCPDGRLASVASVGIVAWTLLDFIDSDLGGQATVLMSVLVGVALWWAAQPGARTAARGAG
jgi:O-antigen ligase